MSSLIRSFIAVDVNSEHALTRIVKLQNTLVNTGANIKLVKPENVHVTIRFLGNVNRSLIDLICEEMNKVSFPPFEVKIVGLGVFPSSQKIRIIWAGIREGAEKLRNLAGQVEFLLRKLDIKSDRKRFSPHLTIARVKTKQRRAELSQCITNFSNYEFGAFRADCLKIKKSTLTPRGPIYDVIHKVNAVTNQTV